MKAQARAAASNNEINGDRTLAIVRSLCNCHGGGPERPSIMRTAVAFKREPGGGEAASAASAPADELAWLAAIRVGDERAFRFVVDRYLPQLLGISRRMLRDPVEAEDMAQETLVRLWRNAATLELGDGGLRPWLHRVISNLCIDRTRSGRRLAIVDEVPEQSEPASQVRSLIDRDLSGRVDAALKALPERQRLALTLFHYEGLSQIEVGAILGISDEAVESLLARGRRALKATLKDDWQQLLPDDG